MNYDQIFFIVLLSNKTTNPLLYYHGFREKDDQGCFYHTQPTIFCTDKYLIL